MGETTLSELLIENRHEFLENHDNIEILGECIEIVDDT